MAPTALDDGDDLDRRQREFDRRKHRRDELQTLATVSLADPAPAPAFTAEAENISRTGMLLTCARDAAVMLAPGDLVRVVLPAQPTQSSVEVEGRIRWQGPADPSRPDVHLPAGAGGKAAQLGLQFENVPEATYRKLAPDRIEDD